MLTSQVIGRGGSPRRHVNRYEPQVVFRRLTTLQRWNCFGAAPVAPKALTGRAVIKAIVVTAMILMSGLD
jgi:hypothetical protein